jgi:hypothetical protein
MLAPASTTRALSRQQLQQNRAAKLAFAAAARLLAQENGRHEVVHFRPQNFCKLAHFNSLR